jgi:hypothetical protein
LHGAVKLRRRKPAIGAGRGGHLRCFADANQIGRGFVRSPHASKCSRVGALHKAADLRSEVDKSISQEPLGWSVGRSGISGADGRPKVCVYGFPRLPVDWTRQAGGYIIHKRHKVATQSGRNPWGRGDRLNTRRKLLIGCNHYAR